MSNLKDNESTIDPSCLPLSARKALFERQTDNIKKPFSSNVKLLKESKVNRPYLPESPATKKPRHEKIKENNGINCLRKLNFAENDDAKENNAKKNDVKENEAEENGASLMPSKDPFIKNHSEDINNDLSQSFGDETNNSIEFIDFQLPKMNKTNFQENSALQISNKVDENNYEEKNYQINANHFDNNQINKEKEALDAFKEIDAYSIDCDEPTVFDLVDKKSLKESDLSSVSDHFDDPESPMGSSTKIYSDIQYDETNFLVPQKCVFKKTNVERNSPSKLSPIQATSSIQHPLEVPIEPTSSIISFKQEENIKNSSGYTPVRTLSMYRRQQKIKNAQQKCEINFGMQDKERTLEEQRQYKLEKTKKLEELQIEINTTRKVIEQSIKALTVCIETKNATSRMEAEKIVLLNGRKLRAYTDEIDRLRSEKHSENDPEIKGIFELNELNLFIKGHFLVSQANGLDSYVYYFVCLFICGDKVLATEVLDTSRASPDSSLCFLQKIKFCNLTRNFHVKVEIYGLALSKSRGTCAERKLLNLTKFASPHRIKNKPKPLQSPITPVSNFHITTSFKLLGSFIFTRNNCNAKRYNLVDNLENSPCEGTFSATIKISGEYNINHRCYLNIKEKVNDYWNWNRRWCVIEGYHLNYWRFEKDEENGKKLGSIDFSECVNPEIKRAKSDICMRDYSFTFLTYQKKKKEFCRYIVAADMEIEMYQWINCLNKLVDSYRFWELDSMKPLSEEQIDKLMKNKY